MYVRAFYSMLAMIIISATGEVNPEEKGAFLNSNSEYAHLFSVLASSLFRCSSASLAFASFTVSPSFVRNSSTKASDIFVNLSSACEFH